MKHKHHIIPRHMGGTDEPENLIELTPEEHAEEHRKLYEEYGHWQDNNANEGQDAAHDKRSHRFSPLGFGFNLPHQDILLSARCQLLFAKTFRS